MADDEIDLSKDEIWDDSALIDSWNQALDEYKKYHSIYSGNSKGLQQSPPPHQPSAVSPASAPAPEAAGVPECEKLDAKTETNKATTAPSTRETSADKETKAGAAGSNGVVNARIAPPPPEALIGSVQDEGLKSMLMAWYYAGYYTGLYEGQQKAQTQQGL
ncbi:hypothetical protein MAPG_08684 [Magnaporthiopsis poae ATCC 64411]|uniref:Uncharacterized protein n=1 Tax=Magnaporthiopsis poae (strain ATCC 64411 / 73-15) TaxID=644358 RepID=A0A0C4E800_MAGP6|nr:hypothetical protein MAPG_08684 [Magnaporthiopsis poae ATCC 64411]